MPSVLLATAGYDHTVRLWEASNGKCHRKLSYMDSQVNSLVISADKRYIAAAGNPHTRLYDTQSNDSGPLRSFDGHVNNVNAAGFQKDGRWMYTGSDDGTLKIWDLRAPGIAREFGTCQREYDNGAGINSVVLHPNQGELIAGDENGNIRVFDLTQNKMSYEQPSGVGSAVRSISIAADASLAATSHDNGMVILWKLPNSRQTVSHFEERHAFQAHEQYVRVALLCVCLFLVQFNSRPLLKRCSRIRGPSPQRPPAQALKCSLSPDMSCLATASSDSTVKLWNISDLLSGPRTPVEPATILRGHQRWVWDCVFSLDSAYLVSASSDHTARLWDLSTGESIREYTGHTKAVCCVALSDKEEPCRNSG